MSNNDNFDNGFLEFVMALIFIAFVLHNAYMWLRENLPKIIAEIIRLLVIAFDWAIYLGIRLIIICIIGVIIMETIKALKEMFTLEHFKTTTAKRCSSIEKKAKKQSEDLKRLADVLAELRKELKDKQKQIDKLKDMTGLDELEKAENIKQKALREFG